MSRESSLVIEYLRYRSLDPEGRRQFELGLGTMVASGNRWIAVYALSICKIIDSESLAELAGRARVTFSDEEWQDADQLVVRVLRRLSRPSAMVRGAGL